MTGEPPLRDLQTWMRDALLYPRQVSSAETERRLVASPLLSAAEGLAIYQRGYFLRIAHCMREQFPALCHALGEDLFNDFVAEYIRDKPPESYTLHDLGRRFPAWLEETRPDRDAEQRETWVDFVIELARFERQVFTMFDAEGWEGKPFADEATPDRLLRLQPCLVFGSVSVSGGGVLPRRAAEPVSGPAAVRAELRRAGANRLREPHHSVARTAFRVPVGAAGRRTCRRWDRRGRRAHGDLRRGRVAVLEGAGRIRRRWLAAGFFIRGPA